MKGWPRLCPYLQRVEINCTFAHALKDLQQEPGWNAQAALTLASRRSVPDFGSHFLDSSAVGQRAATAFKSRQPVGVPASKPFITQGSSLDTYLGRNPCDPHAIRLSFYHCFPCTSVPSVALHVVEFTFARGFESYLRSHSLSGLGIPETFVPSAQTALRMGLWFPPFANCAKDGAPTCIGRASKIKSLGHPPHKPRCVWGRGSRPSQTARRTGHPLVLVVPARSRAWATRPIGSKLNTLRTTSPV